MRLLAAARGSHRVSHGHATPRLHLQRSPTGRITLNRRAEGASFARLSNALNRCTQRTNAREPIMRAHASGCGHQQ